MPPPHFTPLELLEDRLWAALTRAATGDRSLVSVRADPNTPTVRGAFLRWFLLEAVPQSGLPITQIVLEGATVTDGLDLEGATLKVQPRFVRCIFSDTINLNDATIIGFDLISGEADEIRADRLRASGSLQIRKAIQPEPLTGGFRLKQRLRLCGAEIHGNLDLRGCTMNGDAGEKTPLFADGVNVDGNVLLSDGFVAKGEIRLNGATIGRNLDCTGAHLTNRAGYSIAAAGAHIKGSVYLCHTPDWITYAKRNPFVSIGTVRFEGAEIEGDFDCSNGQFTAAPFAPSESPPTDFEDCLYALKADGMTVHANLKLSSDGKGKSFVRGAISLINANVGEDLDCEGARFDLPGEEVFTADAITVSGKTLLSGLYTNGLLRFASADLKQGFRVRGATFDVSKTCLNFFRDENISVHDLDGHACGIYAPLTQVGGVFTWEGIEKNAPAPRTNVKFWLFLPGATANLIRDDETSWQALDRFDVVGCRYGAIDLLGDPRWRLHELDCEYAILEQPPVGPVSSWQRLRRGSKNSQIAKAIERFAPQPYLQLARTYRSAGYERAANDILLHFQRIKTRHSDFGPLLQIGRRLLDVFLRYGFSPFRPLLWLAGVVAITALFFKLAFCGGYILSTKDVPAPKPPQASSTAPRPAFSSVLYAIDTLVPIVDFNQKKSWGVEMRGPVTPVPNPSCSCYREVGQYLSGWIVTTVLVFNTLFGWAMTTFLAAGVSGLLRTGREEA